MSELRSIAEFYSGRRGGIVAATLVAVWLLGFESPRMASAVTIAVVGLSVVVAAVALEADRQRQHLTTAVEDATSPRKDAAPPRKFFPAASAGAVAVELQRGGSGERIEALAGSVVLNPTADYHMEELGPLAYELARRGLRPVFAVSTETWPKVESSAQQHRFPYVEAPEAGPWLERITAFVTLNDWGAEGREYVEVCNALGVTTFGKVEGAQDFEDDDITRERHAYRRVRHLLCQGQNDVDATPGQHHLMVGSTRLERIWNEPAVREPTRRVVANVNFTYGVLTEARDAWIGDVADGCARVGVPLVASMHPAERPLGQDIEVASIRMVELLKDSSVLISRFSTVPFEAMARGVPFIYHNPHGETVPTFKTSDGAFWVSTTADELADALVEADTHMPGYRAMAEPFLMRQISIDNSVPSEVRAADAIASILGGGSRQ